MKLHNLFLSFVQERHLSDETGILIAFSGGPDSVFLALQLLELRHTFRKMKLSLGYVNHCLREDSGKEEEFVESFARKNGLPLFIKKCNVRALSAREGISIEMAARKLRHPLLENMRRESGANYTALAHNADDQAETVILNLCRGCGIKGLRAMLPSDGKLIRPLLFISKKEILGQLEKEGIRFVSDPTNSDTGLLRNYARHEVLPRLRQINPKAVTHIGETCSILAGIDSCLEEIATREIEKCLRHRGEFFSLFSRQALAAVPSLLLAEGFKRYMEPGIFMDSLSVKRLCCLVNGRSGRQVQLSRGFSAENSRSMLVILDENRLAKWKDVLIEWGIEKAMLPVWKTRLLLGDNAASSGRCAVDLRKDLQYPLKVRTMMPGDTFRFNGRTRKLKKFYQDRGLTGTLRKLWPVLVDAREMIVWVIGLAADERALPTGRNEVLHMELEEELIGTQET